MQLDNGLTVIIKENHAQPIVSVQVWVKVGSINETKQTNGLSHFLEHLIFKGTEKYPGQDIARIVETQGGVINAGTSKEFTHFYIDIQRSGYEEAVRILADAMANCIFPKEELERERPVVVEEINRHVDNPGSVLYDLFSAAVFPTTPYKDSIIGSAEVIRNVSRDEIINYYHTYYTPNNMIVTIAGDVDAEKALALVKETFGRQQKRVVPKEPSLDEPLHPASVVRQPKDVEHVYWVGGFVGPLISSKDQFAADVASTILGGGRSSRLFRKLREEQQLVYSISASYWSQRGSGVMTVSAVFEPQKEKEVAAAVDREFVRLMEEGPSEAEIKRAIEMSKAQWFFSLETYHEQASTIGYWILQGRPDMVDIYIKSIEKVTREDVVNFLKKYYKTQGLSQSLLVPEAK